MSDVIPSHSDALRADKWLWHARLVKTRTLAARIIGDGKLRINGRRAPKASALVRPGDVLTVAIHGRVRVARILGVGTRRGPAAEAQALYEDLSPEPVKAPSTQTAKAQADIAPSPRPTRRERRQRDKLNSFSA